MSLLAGIGEGLQGAGRAIGNGFFMYATQLREDERERMREKSLEKRWAREDARQAKLDKRYEDQLKRDENRYKDTQDYRERQAELQSGREARVGEKQDATLLGQSLDRLEKLKASKEKELAQMFTDPMTKQIIDMEAYQAAMADLQKSYLEDASKLVSRSGLSEEQINKYGFSMYLPEQEPIPDPVTPEPSATPAASNSFDVSGWANSVRQPKPEQTAAMPQPGETKRDMAIDFLLNDRGQVNRKPGLLSPDTIAEQNDYMKRMRENGIQSAYGASMMSR